MWALDNSIGISICSMNVAGVSMAYKIRKALFGLKDEDHAVSRFCYIVRCLCAFIFAFWGIAVIYETIFVKQHTELFALGVISVFLALLFYRDRHKGLFWWVKSE